MSDKTPLRRRTFNEQARECTPELDFADHLNIAKITWGRDTVEGWLGHQIEYDGDSDAAEFTLDGVRFRVEYYDAEHGPLLRVWRAGAWYGVESADELRAALKEALGEKEGEVTRLSCQTCEHKHVASNNAPCTLCFGVAGHPKWTPKPEPEPLAGEDLRREVCRRLGEGERVWLQSEFDDTIAPYEVVLRRRQHDGCEFFADLLHGWRLASPPEEGAS